MNLDSALQTFITESRDLLQGMEFALLSLENDPENHDAIHAVFRAAHTIKGSAGLFGLDGIVSFTHVVESLLDRVRDGQVAVETGLIVLLLGCADHMVTLIERLEQPDNLPDDEEKALEESLIRRLNAYLDGPSEAIPRAEGSCSTPITTPAAS